MWLIGLPMSLFNIIKAKALEYMSVVTCQDLKYLM